MRNEYYDDQFDEYGDKESSSKKKGEKDLKAQIVSQVIVDSFMSAYTPCVFESEADEVFTIGRLRDYLCAYVTPGEPDLLPPYLEILKENGFLMKNSYAGQPAVFVKYK